MEKKLDEYIIDSLYHFGKGVNTERNLASVFDGLKPVYRRVIYTALNSGDKMRKTASISGNTLSTVHPHSSDSVDAVISSLVRWGILEGQGNHGMKMIYGDDIQPSASRYTEARVNPGWRSLLSELMPYVPYVEAEIEGNVEPRYIPTPLPMILLFNGLGISYGINGRYPMFTPQSLLEAHLHDNPNLLRAPFGLEIDLENSELDQLWRTGLGRITYRYKVERCGIEAGYGTMISGAAEIFKPNLEKGFDEELSKGQVYILDQTQSEIPQVFVGRSPNVRAVTDEDIYETCRQLCTHTRMFRLSVTDGEQAYLIPLREWLKETIDNYKKLIDKFKEDKISKLEFNYRVFSWLPKVAECQIQHRDYESQDIVNTINDPDCDLEVVNAILSKSIKTLRNVDSTAKLDQIKSQIEEYKSIDPQQRIIDIINEL